MTDYELLFAMRAAMHPLSPGEVGGSHSEVFSFDPKELRDVFEDLAQRHGGNVQAARAQADKISGRFLVKVGNIHDYVVKLKDDKASTIRRYLVSEAFGPAGYNLAPTLDKLEVDGREAVREIPYLAYGDIEDQFAPDILGNAAKVISGHRPTSKIDGTFSIREANGQRIHRSAYDIWHEDPYLKASIPDFAALRRFQAFLREHPIDTTMTARLQSFFNAPITVGFRDTLRFLEGGRHPNLGWDKALDIIHRSFMAHPEENFLPPEINYYTKSIALHPDTVVQISKANTVAASYFAKWLVARLPFNWTTHISDSELHEIASGILEIHHEYPLFEVEPYSGVFSTAGLRLLLRLAVGTFIHLSGMDIPERRNPISESLAQQVRPVARFLEGLSESDRSKFLVIVNGMLWEMAVAGGVPDGNGGVHPFKRIDQTFYSFQEKAQYSVQSIGSVHDLLTMEDLLTSRGQAVLDSHPALSRKLVVFFVLAYRYFHDSGHAPDFRPDDAGLDLFVRGIWGYKTRNVLITIGKDKKGRPIEQIRFVDNKDQFKQYRRFEDSERPLGLIKHGIRLVEPVVRPAMERSIGMYVQKVADQEGIEPADIPDLPKLVASVTRQVMQSGVDSALVHSGAILHDAIDDTSNAVERVLRKMPRRKGR